MKKKTLLFTIFYVFSMWFIPHNSYAYIEKNNAVLRIMDKAAGKTQIVSAVVNKNISYDGLRIKVRSCKQTDPFEAENFYAFIEIYTKNDTRIFSGWMNHNEPGQNPLQNESYDVWLEKCE